MKAENFVIDVDVDILKRSSKTLGITLMSQDINNYTFALKIKQDGELLALDDSYEVEVLSIFTTSKTSRLVKGAVRTHQVEWVFDTSYISKSEVVKNYVYVRKDGELLVSADANCFIFSVGLSEIDKNSGRVAEVYDENYQRYLDEFKDVADFTKIEAAEADRESAENIRKSNELDRIQAESLRQSEFEANEASREQQTTIVNVNGNARLKYWFGSQDSYDALMTKDSDTIYDIWEV